MDIPVLGRFGKLLFLVGGILLILSSSAAMAMGLYWPTNALDRTLFQLSSIMSLVFGVLILSIWISDREVEKKYRKMIKNIPLESED